MLGLGAIALILGVLAVFQGFSLGSLNPWALVVLGVVFFFAGISLLKYQSGSKA